jgi:glutathione S-transferase
MVEVELFSAAVCPFAQRSRLVLLEKEIEFKLIEIDLQHKPADFLQISPYGKVPVLRHGSTRVWESAVVNEYLEEVFPQPPLLPAEPAARAIARISIDFANTQLIPAFYQLLLAQTLESQQLWAAELERRLQLLEADLAQRSGPFWLAGGLSLVDFSYYPWFERWPVLVHYRGFDGLERCPQLLAWVKTMETLPSVGATTLPASYYIEQYADYAAGTATGTTAQELRRSSALVTGS